MNIEIGRYIKIPAELKYCMLCHFLCIEDEVHFSLFSFSFATLRNKLFDQIAKVNKTSLFLPNQHKPLYRQCHQKDIGCLNVFTLLAERTRNCSLKCILASNICNTK